LSALYAVARPQHRQNTKNHTYAPRARNQLFGDILLLLATSSEKSLSLVNLLAYFPGM
jgi:hypothetical protein